MSYANIMKLYGLLRRIVYYEDYEKVSAWNFNGFDAHARFDVCDGVLSYANRAGCGRATLS